MSHKRTAAMLLRIARGILGQGFGMPDQIFPGENPNIEEEHEAAMAKLDKHFTRVDKGVRSIWFEKGKSLALNMPITGGIQVMFFSFLPGDYFLKRYITNDRILPVQPNWISSNKYSYRSYEFVQIVDKLIKLLRQSEDLKKNVNRQLDEVEREYKVEIPRDTREDIVKYCLKLQKSRLTANQLKIKPKVFLLAEEEEQK